MTYIIAEPCIDIKIAPAWTSAQRGSTPVADARSVPRFGQMAENGCHFGACPALDHLHVLTSAR
jgi:hypothetical protein